MSYSLFLLKNVQNLEFGTLTDRLTNVEFEKMYKILSCVHFCTFSGVKSAVGKVFLPQFL